ncbi:MAG TPA: hypothetical protein PK227_08425 [Thermomonas sp.]|jgi:hypothetical protein|nr:hypothetical protein [Thermomonas sp.]
MSPAYTPATPTSFDIAMPDRRATMHARASGPAIRATGIDRA